MTYYILNKDRVPVRVSGEEAHRRWKQENMKVCEVGRSYIGGVMICTRFRGFDPSGAGYLFYTVIKSDDGERYEQYGAKTWETASQQYCEQHKRLEDELLVRMRKEARLRREQR
jgi:hypothetical protein